MRADIQAASIGGEDVYKEGTMKNSVKFKKFEYIDRILGLSLDERLNAFIIEKDISYVDLKMGPEEVIFIYKENNVETS